MKSIVRLCAISALVLGCGSDDPKSPDFGAGGDGGIGGDGGNGSGLDSGNSGICQSTTVGTDRGTPDILIVLDRSGSMSEDNNDQGVDRWGPSVRGIQQITGRLQDRIAFGLMAFPGTGGGGGGGTTMCDPSAPLDQYLQCVFMQAGGGGGGGGGTCAAGSLNVPIGLGNAQVIASALQGMRPNGATPTVATLQAAAAELGKLTGSPDQPPRARYVLLVTDGAPNCFGGGNNSQDPAAVEASVAEIQKMAGNQIKTYVLGYNARSNPELSSALDRMAVAGATGDTMFRAVEDEQSLVATFEQIAGSVVTCDFVLDAAVADPSYVKVLFDGEQLQLNAPDGWTISADRRNVTLQGPRCEALKQGGHTVNVSVECSVQVY